jgi:hypothetical protein
MIAPKDRAHLRRGQRHRYWQIAPKSADLAASAFRPIECDEDQPGFPGAHGLAHLLESSNRETSAAGETKHLAATPHQQSLDAIRKLVRRCHRPAGRACEEASGYRKFKYISARSQPETPPG